MWMQSHSTRFLKIDYLYELHNNIINLFSAVSNINNQSSPYFGDAHVQEYNFQEGKAVIVVSALLMRVRWGTNGIGLRRIKDNSVQKGWNEFNNRNLELIIQGSVQRETSVQRQTTWAPQANELLIDWLLNWRHIFILWTLIINE